MYPEPSQGSFNKMDHLTSSRQVLVTCLRSASPEYTRDDTPSVIDVTNELWPEATLPYNLRLKNSVRPLAVAYPQTPKDIASAISCARQSRVPTVARSGGTSFAAYSLGGSVDPDSLASSSSGSRKYPPPQPGKNKDKDGSLPAEPSLVIDMRSFRNINFNFHEKTVTVGAGALVGELGLALEKVGRMVPIGNNPLAGVGGQALSGGYGAMSRSHGLLLDNMLSADLVLANGQITTVSKLRRPDLYWGIRGGGSSLAIAHSFTFRTHPTPPQIIYHELTLLPRSLSSDSTSVERATNLYLAFQEYGNIASERLSLSWYVMPESDGHGGWGTNVKISGQFVGNEEDYQREMGKFEEVIRQKGVGEIRRSQRIMTYLESMLNAGGNWTALAERGPINTNEHINFYSKNLVIKQDLLPTTIETHLKHLLSSSAKYNPTTQIEWSVHSPYLGGQKSAIRGYSNTAFAHRDLRIVWEVEAKNLATTPGDGVERRDPVDFVTQMVNDLGPVQATYPAYADPELGANEYPRLIWGDNYPRLQFLKKQYDPENVFRSPQSIRPETSFPWATLWLCLVGMAVFLWVMRHLRQRWSTKVRME